MEQEYWLSRKRASVQMARNATNSEARLVHYELAGRYSLKAMSAEFPGSNPADILPPPIMANHKSGRLRCAGND